jgi:hypothetical protein
MTPKKFLRMFLLQLIFITAVKVYFFKNYDFSNALNVYLYWLAIVVITAAFVRRLGIMNFLEAFIVCILWFVTDLFVDLIFTSGIAGLSIFTTRGYWSGHVMMLATILIAHKKKHIHARHHPILPHGTKPPSQESSPHPPKGH